MVVRKWGDVNDEIDRLFCEIDFIIEFSYVMKMSLVFGL